MAIGMPLFVLIAIFFAVDIENARQAPDCTITYVETTERAGAMRSIPRQAVFEIDQETREPPLGSLFEGLAENERACLDTPFRLSSRQIERTNCI